MRNLATATACLVAITSAFPMPALAAGKHVRDAGIKAVDEGVPSYVIDRAGFLYGTACEGEFDGATHDCYYAAFEDTAEDSYTGYLYVHDACRSGALCSDGVLAAMVLEYTVDWARNTAEIESEVYIADDTHDGYKAIGTTYTTYDSDIIDDVAAKDDGDNARDDSRTTDASGTSGKEAIPLTLDKTEGGPADGPGPVLPPDCSAWENQVGFWKYVVANLELVVDNVCDEESAASGFDNPIVAGDGNGPDSDECSIAVAELHSAKNNQALAEKRLDDCLDAD